MKLATSIASPTHPLTLALFYLMILTTLDFVSFLALLLILYSPLMILPFFWKGKVQVTISMAALKIAQGHLQGELRDLFQTHGSRSRPGVPLSYFLQMVMHLQVILLWRIWGTNLIAAPLYSPFIAADRALAAPDVWKIFRISTLINWIILWQLLIRRTLGFWP